MEMELGASASRAIAVGVGEYKVLAQSQETLVTYSLGSCVGVTAFDPRAGVGGLLHFMLPDSGMNEEKAERRPAMFGDTGLAAFLKELFDRGATRPHLEVKLAGGARALSGSLDFFKIGERNLLTAKRFLWMNGIFVSKEDTGGNEYRTVYLDLATGRVVIKDPSGKYPL
jgi:chemotaxis protein CheD